jgi:hypothetical protein
VIDGSAIGALLYFTVVGIELWLQGSSQLDSAAT